MKIRTMILAWAVTVLMWPALGAAQELIDLRPRFVAGQVSRFEVWSLRDQAISMQAGPEQRQMQTRMQIDGEVTWRVDRVDGDGGATCTMTIDWVLMTLTDAQGNVMVNDTRRATGDIEQAHQTLRAMVGTPLTVSVAADGSVTGVRGVEAIQARLPQGARATEEIEFIELASGLATLPYAPAQLDLGQRWTITDNWSHELGWMQYTTGNTLTSTEEIASIPVAVVNSTSKLRFTPDLEKMGIPAEIQLDIRMQSGSMQGQTMFDLSRHEVIGQNSIRTTTIQMQGPAGDGGQRMVQTINETLQGQVLRISEE